MTKLTEHFTLEELTASSTARTMGIDNTPRDQSVIIALAQLAVMVLEPIRQHFREPVVISSGYRSPRLNQAVGGVANSQHLLGQAADIYLLGDTRKEQEYFRWIQQNINYDQLILEGNQRTSWIHVSFNSLTQNRHKSWMQLLKTAGA